MTRIQELYERVPNPYENGPHFQIMISRHWKIIKEAKKYICRITGKKTFSGDTPEEALENALTWYDEIYIPNLIEKIKKSR